MRDFIDRKLEKRGVSVLTIQVSSDLPLSRSLKIEERAQSRQFEQA